MLKRNIWRGCLLVWALVAGAAGCGSAGDAGAGLSAARTKNARLPPSAEAARRTANMVKAVSIGAGTVEVDLKFELAERPEVGKPVDIVLALIPNVRLERLYARFQPEDGLDLVTGGETEQITRPVAGESITHTVTVIPKRDGIFTIRAVVLMDSETESLSHNYSIPLIAGSGLPEWAVKGTAVRGEAKPQRPSP